MDYTVHEILQATRLEWVAFPFSGDLPDPGIESRSPALQMDSLPTEPPEKPWIRQQNELITIMRRPEGRDQGSRKMPRRGGPEARGILGGTQV